jgi:hypothetical protein
MARPMISDSEVKISAEGILVSGSQGPSRLWEFHPDDVTSVGIYRGEAQMHEVIAALNRDFDIPVATSGLKELNGRLSRELNATLTIDVEHGSSSSGIVLWPPHLAGSPLWEFCVLAEDGLARYVAPGTPNAVRNLSHAVCREMARLAKHHLPDGFPKPLFDRGFIYHGEIGWYRDDAVMVAEWLHGKGAAIVDAELWLVTNAVVQPHIRTATGTVAYRYWTTTQPSETWEALANRSLSDVAGFIRQFQWPENAAEPVQQEVRFCLSWVWKEWLVLSSTAQSNLS